jgi:hypothetical protein
MSEPTYPQPPADRSVKVPHLVFGLLFLGVAGIWALGASDAISGEHLAVLGPGVLILAGVIGLAASLANGRNRRRRAAIAHQPESYDASTYDSTTYPANDTTHDHVADNGDDPTEEIR